MYSKRANTMGCLEGLLDLLFPPVCTACGGRTAAAELAICDPCLRRPERLKPETARKHLDRAGTDVTAWTNIFALWSFDKAGAVQHLQHALKYGNKPCIGLQLGGVIGRAFHEAYSGFPWSSAIVVPVPLSRARYLERGYNQSELLARGFAASAPTVVTTDALVRVRNTRSQIGLSRSERRSNVEGAFRLERHHEVDGKNVVLIDDVLTTGSTLRAASQPLLERPVASISIAGLCLANQL